MSSKTKEQKRARALQALTGWSYSECLRHANAGTSDAAIAELIKIRGGKAGPTKLKMNSLYGRADAAGTAFEGGSYEVRSDGSERIHGDDPATGLREMDVRSAYPKGESWKDKT